ncbi:MAG: glycine cleavage system protein T, partial [Boseongicola sp.]|nr:glycine cleavage system protein T [Boseongicola sp.]
VLRAAFGDAPTDLKYYWFMEYDWEGVPLVISRTGWSSELGYEIFLRDGSAGDRLWEHLMAVGQPLGLKPGHTSSIRRIEAGMLSYHADMTLANNPYEMGMDRLVNLEIEADFVGKSALAAIKKQGVTQSFVGLEVDGDALVGSNDTFWVISSQGAQVGYVTSAVHSPRLGKNIALAMVAVDQAEVGNRVVVETEFGSRSAVVVPKPFYDPSKAIAAQS